MTLMSGKVYSDSGTPSNITGENGDIFMQLDGLKTTYRKEGGAWTPIGNQLGTIPEFLKGVGVPPNVLGQDNQYYREVNTDAIYEKQAGVWTNIGSWTSLEIQQLLLSNGIGADLATTNWLTNVSLNDVTEVGEYYYSTGVTNFPVGVDAGMMKVWRLNANNVGQLVQPVIGSSYSPWHIRLSTGGTWGAWVACANQNGDPTRKFKALAGTANDDVATVGQLLNSGLKVFGSTYNIITTSSFNIPPQTTYRMVLIGGGGGSAGYETGHGGDGGDSYLTIQGGSEIFRSKGGVGSYPGYGVNSGHGVQPARGRNTVEINGSILSSILVISKNDPDLVQLSKVDGYGNGGGRDTGYVAVPNVVEAGEAGFGGVLEFLIKNLSTTEDLVLDVVTGAGGIKTGGNATNGSDGVVAYLITS